jgi:ubiquinone/menaquinone biosynthesis C-methylase UbiE
MCSALVARKSSYDVQSDARPYALGYSDDEFGRLERQGGYYRDLTEDVLVRAGIGEGMRILDVGCGVGDVSLIAGRLGPTGSVLGVDRSPEAIETAGRRVEEAGQGGFVRFTSAELDTYRPAAGFDAVIGRFIPMYLPDPAGALRRFAACIEPGGVVVFHEMAIAQARSLPEGPLFRQCLRWITETFMRTGFEIDMGGKLYRTFLAAGLPAPQMIAAARVEAGPDAFAYAYVAQTLRSLLPVAERTGVATRAEIDVDSLAARLRGEALQNSACTTLPTLIGAWSTTPGVSEARRDLP